MVRFEANNVTVDRSGDDFILVGFAEERDGQYREALHFQRALQFDEQDAALRMDQVYVERLDQTQSAYGGIERVALMRDRLEVVVGTSTAKSLGDSLFHIQFSLTDSAFEKLAAGLREVFEGFAFFIESAR